MSQSSLLLYIHGFNSSSQSNKATQIRSWLNQNHPDIEVRVPDLPYCPDRAVAILRGLIEHCDDVGVVGSSLGGFYANYLSEQYGLRAVMVNPAVRPHELLTDYLGVQTNPYTNETYVLDETHIRALKAIFVATMQVPSNRLVLLQTGDETLDYSEAEKYYSKSRLIVEKGGDHSFINFERHFSSIVEFLF